MHYQDNNNQGQPGQPQQPGQPTGPVAGVEPVTAARPKGPRVKAIVGGFVGTLLVVACCGLGASVFGGGEQSAAVKAAPEINVPATTAPAATTPAAPEPTETEPEPTQETLGLPLGVTVTATDSNGEVEITVSQSKKYPKPRKKGCGDYPQNPDAGLYLVVDVKMEVVKGTGSINSLFFQHVDPDGYTTSTSTGIFSGCGKDLSSGNNLPKGTKRSGQMVFDLASAKGEIEFGGPLGDRLASWNVG